MPRRLAAPALLDDLVRLEPLTRALVPDMRWVLERDADTAAFTYIPTEPDEAFLERWVGRYEDGWEDGSCAGFAVRDADGDAVGFAAFVRLDLDGRQGELGYVIAPAARGRGIATRAVDLLTRWGLDELGLERIELRIDPRNAGSERVAERAGYAREGVLRSLAFKEGKRADVAIWSRLPAD
ncbi:MAG TPA: GNAT family protein [Gaiellaceae bacterium]